MAAELASVDVKIKKKKKMLKINALHELKLFFNEATSSVRYEY